MNIVEATQGFEHWLAEQLPLVRRDIALKHARMAVGPFSCFRATFYRWLEQWPAVCGDLATAPALLAVGDLHIENFGTWRDREGRLIWGVNDVDEAWPAPYTLDLVRLTTSAYLAIREEHLSVRRREAAEGIEEGYRDAVRSGGKAFVLAEEHQWLRLLALSDLRDPIRFWEKMRQHSPYTGALPKEVRKLIDESLPSPRDGYQLKRRVAGLGSLGPPRILALSSSEGAFVAREVKRIRRSAWAWSKQRASRRLYGEQLLDQAIRVKDPEMAFCGQWLVRRLAPGLFAHRAQFPSRGPGGEPPSL